MSDIRLRLSDLMHEASMLFGPDASPVSRWEWCVAQAERFFHPEASGLHDACHRAWVEAFGTEPPLQKQDVQDDRPPQQEEAAVDDVSTTETAETMTPPLDVRGSQEPPQQPKPLPARGKRKETMDSFSNGKSKEMTKKV